MSDLRDLHRAILLDPYDDVARLAYADALEESGDATRAEFVRSGVRRNPWATRAAPEAWEPARVPARHFGTAPAGAAWQPGPPPRMARLYARRGLVDLWECSVEDFLACAANFFTRHPITEVLFTGRVPRSVAIATGGTASVRVPRSANHAPGGNVARMSLENWHEWCGATDDHLGANRHTLPYWLFASERESRIAFPQAADAYAWASRAAVNYGRHRAGLPTLGVRARA